MYYCFVCHVISPVFYRPSRVSVLSDTFYNKILVLSRGWAPIYSDECHKTALSFTVPKIYTLIPLGIV